jgi:hypothetical protein
VYAATPRVLITRWLEGVSLSTLLDGRRNLLPEGWRELDDRDAADRAARLLGHAIYAPAACTGWMQLARQAGAVAPDAEVDPRLIIELLHPLAATGAAPSFTYSRPWLRGLMAHLTEPRFAPALRNLTPPGEYALVWRATLSAAGLFAQLGATVPTRGFHLAYSPGFRDGIPQTRPRRTDGALRQAS